MTCTAQSSHSGGSDLRTAIRQATAMPQVAAARHLSEQERAELRRQLSLHSRVAAKRS